MYQKVTNTDQVNYRRIGDDARYFAELAMVYALQSGQFQMVFLLNIPIEKRSIVGADRMSGELIAEGCKL